MLYTFCSNSFSHLLGVWLEFDNTSLPSKQPVYLYSCLAVQPNNVIRSSSIQSYLISSYCHISPKKTEIYFHHQAAVFMGYTFPPSLTITLLRSQHFLLSHHLNLVLVLKLFLFIISMVYLLDGYILFLSQLSKPIPLVVNLINHSYIHLHSSRLFIYV